MSVADDSSNSNSQPLIPPVPAPAAPSETVGEQQQQQQNKKYVKNVIEVVGLESCGHCNDTDMYVNSEVKPNSDVPVEYKKFDANSVEGLAIAKEKNLTRVPYIKQCLIPTDPQKPPECTEINEFKKNFFKIKVNS